MMDRRRFIQSGLALTPIAAFLSACGSKGSWAEGMAEIKWDRDTCTRCKMVISDRRFAAEARGGAKDEAFKFDDVGCAVFWLRDQPWGKDARLWVADVSGKGDRWLDARQAQYQGGRASPMGYNFGAVAQPQTGSLGFDEMQQQVLAKGK